MFRSVNTVLIGIKVVVKNVLNKQIYVFLKKHILNVFFSGASQVIFDLADKTVLTLELKSHLARKGPRAHTVSFLAYQRQF